MKPHSAIVPRMLAVLKGLLEMEKRELQRQAKDTTQQQRTVDELLRRKHNGSR